MARGSGMPWHEWNGHVDLSLEHRKNLMRFMKHSTTILINRQLFCDCSLVPIDDPRFSTDRSC
jgi:hypothetical protein